MVKNENGIGKDRTLHRNLLLPCGSLDTMPMVPDDQLQRRPKTRSRSNQAASNQGEIDADYDTVDVVLGDVPVVMILLPTPTQLLVDAPVFNQRNPSLDAVSIFHLQMILQYNIFPVFLRPGPQFQPVMVEQLTLFQMI